MEPQFLEYALRCPGTPDPIHRGSEGYFKKSRKQTDDCKRKGRRIKKVKKNKKYKLWAAAGGGGETCIVALAPGHGGPLVRPCVECFHRCSLG